jgi:hypothetical protein
MPGQDGGQITRFTGLPTGQPLEAPGAPLTTLSMNKA